MKIIFITSNNMGSLNGGTTLFKMLINNIPTENLYWIGIGPTNNNFPEWLKFRKKIILSSIFLGRNFRFFARRLFRSLYANYCFNIFPAIVEKNAIKFILQNKPNKLWIYINNYTIPVAARLIKNVEIPFHLSIQDDIDGHNTNYEAEKLRSDFQFLLKHCTSVDVTSDSMKNYYEEKYDACHNAYVLWNGAVEGAIPKAPIINEKIKKIGYAGNIWSPDNFKSLLKAIEIINGDRKEYDHIFLDVYIEKFPLHLRINGRFLKVMKPKTSEEIINTLQDYDLVYVPMSFLPEKNILCRTSLPGKILTYMKSQIPLFAHGPSFASNIAFVKNFNIGLVCEKEEATSVAQVILSYENNFNLRKLHSKNCRLLSMSRFNPQSTWKNFENILFQVHQGV